MKVDKIMKLAENLLLKLQGLSRTQAIAALVGTTVAVGGVGTGGYMIYQHNHQPDQVVADVDTDTETQELTETLEAVSEGTEEIVAEVVQIVEETETEAEVEAKELSLVGSSMEKDLKIKVQNQKKKLVSGEEFVVSVKASKNKKAKATEYKDKDKDGIIYIDSIEAGDYDVALAEVEGYEIKKGSIRVTVKDKLEYEKVDVTGEIKKESEVNSKVEDTAVNNIPVENTMQDTVPLLESKAVASKVAKADVDTSAFPKANVSSSSISKTLSKTYEVETPPSTQEPSEKPEGETPPSTQEPSEKPEGETPPSTQEPSEKPEGETPPSTQEPSEKPEGETPPSTQEPSEKPEGETPPSTPQPPSTQEPSEKPGEEQPPSTQIPSEAVTASVSRNAISRVATAEKAKTETITATVSVPTYVNVYYVNTDAAANSYNIPLTIKDAGGVIKAIEWNITDPSKAIECTVANDKKSVKVVGKASGSAKLNITVTYNTDDKGGTATETLQCTVNSGDYSGSYQQMKDKKGNKLYLDDKGKSSAQVRFYGMYDTFYTEPNLYTGWQTLDGKVYYYNADHKAVTGNQVIGGVQYTFGQDGSLSQSSGSRGIDVSKWQGDIDWGAVASSGISFAIIRAGYRGASTGVLVEDPYFRKNIAGATRAGIKVGVYFFTQAITEAEAVEEASMALALTSGYNLSFPIFIDTENASNGRANGLDRGTRTAVVNAFCQTIQNGGRRAGIYASKSWYNNKLNTSSLNGYCIWVAQYNTECTYGGKYDMWQYTSKGTVNGIKGNVDMNISYM